MSELRLLKKQIEKERGILDSLAIETDDMTSCCIQSRKLDALIEKYYQMLQNESVETEDGELSSTFPPLCV